MHPNPIRLRLNTRLSGPHERKLGEHVVDVGALVCILWMAQLSPDSDTCSDGHDVRRNEDAWYFQIGSTQKSSNFPNILRY